MAVAEVASAPPDWVEDAVAPALCFVGAFWTTSWNWPAPPAWVDPPVCVCCAVCVTVLELLALETAVDVFVADEPIDAGTQIWIRVPGTPEPVGSVAGTSVIETPAFVGATCADVALEPAVCDVGAS